MEKENGLTRDELLNIIVALDNEAVRDAECADKLRKLKWKVFKIMTETSKEG